jgi:hypothetical protein
MIFTNFSLFSISREYDVLLACYADNRYELETKYTSMIDLGSRGTLPRYCLLNIHIVISMNSKTFQLLLLSILVDRIARS